MLNYIQFVKIADLQPRRHSNSQQIKRRSTNGQVAEDLLLQVSQGLEESVLPVVFGHREMEYDRVPAECKSQDAKHQQTIRVRLVDVRRGRI